MLCILLFNFHTEKKLHTIIWYVIGHNIIMPNTSRCSSAKGWESS